MGITLLRGLTIHGCYPRLLTGMILQVRFAEGVVFLSITDDHRRGKNAIIKTGLLPTLQLTVSIRTSTGKEGA